MLTHKIRDMPQHVFRNSTQSPSSDSNNSLSASAAAAAAAYHQMQQKSQLSESHLQPSETVVNLSDSDRSHRQLNALTAEKDNEFDKNVSMSTLTGVDQSNPTYLTSDDSSSMPSSPQQTKNGVNNFGRRSGGGGANSKNDNDSDDNSEVQSSTRSSAAINIPQHESETSPKNESDGDNAKESERKIEKPLKDSDHCQICSKRFDSFAALETHMRSHKQFHCTICDKSFSTKGNLKVIFRIRSFDSVFSCARLLLGSYGITWMAWS